MTRAQRLGRTTATVLLWVLTIFMALIMALVGLPKMQGLAPWLEYFQAWGYAEWFRVLIGTLQVAGGLALLVPRVAVYAAAGLVVIMSGAVVTELTNDVGFGPRMPLVYVVILSLLLVFRWHRARRQREEQQVA
jgi:uncharacterized membrane protein YphA (DoxX/SURF4 family)